MTSAAQTLFHSTKSQSQRVSFTTAKERRSREGLALGRPIGISSCKLLSTWSRKGGGSRAVPVETITLEHYAHERWEEGV